MHLARNQRRRACVIMGKTRGLSLGESFDDSDSAFYPRLTWPWGYTEVALLFMDADHALPDCLEFVLI
jgi:hypothetical protein